MLSSAILSETHTYTSTHTSLAYISMPTPPRLHCSMLCRLWMSLCRIEREREYIYIFERKRRQ
jgi:hypothetical protein